MFLCCEFTTPSKSRLAEARGQFGIVPWHVLAFGLLVIHHNDRTRPRKAPAIAEEWKVDAVYQDRYQF